MIEDTILVCDISLVGFSCLDIPVYKLCDIVLNLGKIGVMSVNVTGSSCKWYVSIMLKKSIQDDVEKYLSKQSLYLDNIVEFRV